MTKCTPNKLKFPALKRRKIDVEFSGGDITSDGGALLLRQIDKRLRLTKDIASAIPDTRNQSYVDHSQISLLRQRIYGLCLGYEDLNDHTDLRHDPAIQTAVEKETVLGSQSTLCRLENRMDNQVAFELHKVMVEKFISSFKSAPKELMLDFDATDDAVHGNQVGKFFHGYYDHYCFMPLYVFCKDQLLVSYLRPSKIDGAKHAWAILSLLVKRLRREWPQVKVIFRGDSGFCRHKMLEWCDRNNIGYVIGLPKNSRLEKEIKPEMKRVAKRHEQTGKAERTFRELQYAAKTWKRKRRVIAKAEHLFKGANPRFIVTNLKISGRRLYEEIYCARGDMENRIKEQQLGMFADRTSCHHWWPNQFRLLLSSMAYILVSAIRRQALKGTEFANAQVTTIRLKLLKIGGVIMRNTRRIRFLLSSSYPYKSTFELAVARLTPE